MRLVSCHRHVSDGHRAYWQVPPVSTQQIAQELVHYAAEAEAKGIVVGLGIRSEVTMVSAGALWRSIVQSFREPASSFRCHDASTKECQGFAQRTLTVNGETLIENIYCNAQSCEVSFRKLCHRA